MIRHFAGHAFRRLLAAARLARAADLTRLREAGARRVAAERARARREAASRVEELRGRIEASHRRAAAEHAQSNTLVGLLRHYLIRLRRTEAELANRVIAERRLKLEQLSIAVKVARRRGIPSEAADRAARHAAASTDYAAAAARWRAGDVPDDVRRATLGHLDWSVPAGTTDTLGRRIVDARQLALDSLAVVRQFAVGGVMLDIGAGIGAASIPRVMLGDFAQSYAAEPETDDYRCLVGNAIENVLEGRVLPYRVAISGTAGTVRAGRPGTTEEQVPAVTLDDWVRQLGVASFDVRFVRVAMREWSLNVLDAAASLLKRRHIVWQIEIDATMLQQGTVPLDGFCRRVEAHFSHVKELGRYWTAQWRPSAEIGAILAALADQRRAANVLVFNLPGADVRRRKRAVPAVAGDAPDANGGRLSLLHATARLPNRWRPALHS